MCRGGPGRIRTGRFPQRRPRPRTLSPLASASQSAAAVASGGAGALHYAYVVKSALYYALWNGVNQSAPAQTTLASSAVNAASADITLGPGGTVHISYAVGKQVWLKTYAGSSWSTKLAATAPYPVVRTRVVSGATATGGVGVGYVFYPTSTAGALHYTCVVP